MEFGSRLSDWAVLFKTALITCKLASLPKGINDSLMTLRHPLTNRLHSTIISAYAPTMTKAVKERFKRIWTNWLGLFHGLQKLFLLGDFNGRVGTDHTTWEAVLGNNGVGKCKRIRLLLVRTCADHDLLITNTVFHLPYRNRTSWMQTLALDRLRPHHNEGDVTCNGEQGNVWHRMLDRP